MRRQVSWGGQGRSVDGCVSLPLRAVLTAPTLHCTALGLIALALPALAHCTHCTATDKRQWLTRKVRRCWRVCVSLPLLAICSCLTGPHCISAHCSLHVHCIALVLTTLSHCTALALTFSGVHCTSSRHCTPLVLTGLARRFTAPKVNGWEPERLPVVLRRCC